MTYVMSTIKGDVVIRKEADSLEEAIENFAKMKQLPKEEFLKIFEVTEIKISGLNSDIDLKAQKIRLEKLIVDKEKQINGFKGRLSNEGYLTNAKPEIIEETRNLLALAEADLEAAQSSLANLD